MQIDRLDHLVLTVRSIEDTCAFYAGILGMTVQKFGNERIALQFGNQRINLHEAGHEFEPKARLATPGSGDLCFITQTPIAEVIHVLEQHHIMIVEGPVPRIGAAGKLQSVYLRDPDGNLVEIANAV